MRPGEKSRNASAPPIELPHVVIRPRDFINDEQITTPQIDGEPVFDDDEEKPPLEIVSEITSAQEEAASVQVDDFNIRKDNNNPLVVEGNDDEENENIAELNSAQEMPTAVQVDDFYILNVNNNIPVVEGHDDEENKDIAKIVSIQESNINESPCKNDDALVVKGATEIVSFQESCENNNTLTVKDDSKENEDDDIQGDDADNEGDEEAFQLDNIKDKRMEIHVRKLHKDTVEDDLVQVFQQFGELKSTKIMRKQNTNQSKGFAFIQFATVEQAKRAISELKDGVEVRGKRVMVSASQNNHSLYLGNIHKTWKKEQVLEQLKHYGIEHVETISIPEDPTIPGKTRGLALLEFNSHFTAATAFQRLQKPDAVFGLDISAKVAFAESGDGAFSQVYVDGLTKDWTKEMVEEIAKKYGEISRIKLCPSTQTKQKDFGFITFTSHESALAFVEGINNSAIGREAKIKANIAKSQPSDRVKQGFRGGFKVEKPSEVSTSNKEGEVSNKNSEPKSSKMKGVLNTQQIKRNKKKSSKNKAPKNKRKASSDQKLINRDQGTTKNTKSGGGGEGKNSKTTFKAGKRKAASAYEAREDRGHGKKPFKKQKGNMYGRDRDNTRNPQNNTRIIRGHDDSRNSTRYVGPYTPKYAGSASNAYHLAPDHSLATRRYTEMEPHAGYIEPAPANQSRLYSGYAQPVVRNPHSQQHQTVYLAPASASQSQVYSGYLDRSALTQSHGGYDGTAVAPEIQPYRDYRQPAVVQIAHDPHDSGLARVVRHDDRVAGGVAYVGGPPFPASQVQDHTSYYQGDGSYSGAYTSQQPYY